MTVPILRLEDVSKVYPGVVALSHVSLDFYPGEAHAVVGENGAGKSTLIKILTGAIQPTEGKLYFGEEELHRHSPINSMNIGISAIYQELSPFLHLSVAENIFFNNYKSGKGFVDFAAMRNDAQKVLNELGLQIAPDTLMRELSVGKQQMVEIAKAISKNAKVIIMDEPSASLTNNEISFLFDVIEKLRAQGIAIIYISHRLEEVFRICDKTTVFRDGHLIKTMETSSTNKEELVFYMVNRTLTDSFPKLNVEKGEKTIEIKNLNTKLLKNISFSVYKGERLGFAGLVGSGRTEIAKAIFGADPITSGEIYLRGNKVVINSPKEAIELGIVLLPEERKKEAVFLELSVRENIIFSFLSKIRNWYGLINQRKEQALCDGQIKSLNIKTPSGNQLIRFLSGGNQQKTVLAKFLLLDCDVIIFDEPTRGIDVGAKQEIYHLINNLSKAGKTIIIISSELPELIGMSDRIIVMSEGQITGELNAGEVTPEKILKLASNSKE